MFAKIFFIFITLILIIVIENKKRKNSTYDDDDEFNIDFIENTDEEIFKNTVKINDMEKTKNNSLYKVEPNIESKIRQKSPYLQVDKLVEWIEEIFKEVYIQIEKGNIEELINICDEDFYLKLKKFQGIRNDVGIVYGIDNINIEFVKVIDYKKDDKINVEYITFAITTILIDDYIEGRKQKSKYFSIIYEITLKRNLAYSDDNRKMSIDSLNCPSCGAPIHMNNTVNKCNYCGKNFIINFSNWKIYSIKREE